MESFSIINPHVVSIMVLQNIVAKEVEIIMGSKSYKGWVQSIDPRTISFFLMKFDEENTCSELVLIPGSSIKSIKVFKESPSQQILTLMDTLFKKNEVYYSKEELNRKKEALCFWLASNRVPYTVIDNSTIQVLQVATIKPPYSTQSIHCKNEVVLDKVIKFVKSAPGLEKIEG